MYLQFVLTRRSVLKRWVLGAGTCLILTGIVMASLVWAVDPSSPPPAGDIAPAGGETARAVTPARTGRGAARVERVDAGRAVQEAWEKAREAGVYTFATDLTQAVYPVKTLSNGGRPTRRAELRLAGEVDQPARTMRFSLSQSGGAGNDAEVRVEGDRAYTRQAGGEWQEIEDFSSGFAPGNDPLAFLAGIKNVADCGLQAREGATEQVACYRFDLDGPALAAFLRDRLQRELAQAGELPQGLTLEVSPSIRDMTGAGELWVDGRGLPLRLTMHLAFPEEGDGSHSEADMQTTFSGFPEEAATAPGFSSDPVAWAGAALGLDGPSLPDRAAETAGVGGMLACILGATALAMVHRRSRRLYSAIAIAVTLSMVVVPLLESEQVVAFFERQETTSQGLLRLGANGQAVDPALAQEEEADRQALADLSAPTWDPLQDPLAQPDETGEPSPAISGPTGETGMEPAAAPAPLAEVLTTAPVCEAGATGDQDKDGVSDYEECVYDTFEDKPDSDLDGLKDGQELNKLGTNPKLADTDGDLLSDKQEVAGFFYENRTWYLDPNNADTNGDGLPDSAECMALVEYAAPTEEQIGLECDTDGDGIPSPFDVDNDGDGVPDSVDLSPESVADRDNLRIGQATKDTAFNRAFPFQLSVPGLTGEWPVLVDVQLRPVEEAHLGYAMNVLDWPENDVEGQIQHGEPDTFADSDNPAINNPDDTEGANGDMRLIPLLEIVMPGEAGNKFPLKMATPVVTVTVGSETALESTVVLKPSPSDAARTQATVSLPAGAGLALYAGTCPNRGALLTPVAGSTDTWPVKVVDLADGNHSAVVSLGADSACANLPDLVNGSSDLMVDASVLDPYGISVKEGYGASDKSLVAYVPLDVVADDTGGGKTAFQARMLHWVGANSSWSEPVQMRVLWLVQMLVDSCADTAEAMAWDEYKAANPAASRDDYNNYFDAYCLTNRSTERAEVVQSYDESWYLTGLSVQEAHGLDIAVAYPYPGGSGDDDALWTLTWGLGRQFLTGRDCGTRDTILAANPAACAGNQVRDLAVFRTDHLGNPIGDSTIEERFGVNRQYPDHRAAWGIDFNDLKVKSFRFDHQDYVGKMVTEFTPDILDEYTAYGHTDWVPTLVFAYEERARAGNIVSGTMESRAFTLDMGSAEHPEETGVGIKWSPFRYNGAEWEAFPSTAYWDVQEADLTARFQQLFPTDSDAATLGRVNAARSYAVGMIVGLGAVVHCTPEDKTCPMDAAQVGASDQEIKQATAQMGGGLSHVAVELVSDLMWAKAPFKTGTVAFDQARNAQAGELRDNVIAMAQGTLTWAAATHPEVVFFEALGAQLLNPGTSLWQTAITSGPALGSQGGGDIISAAKAIIAFYRSSPVAQEVEFYVYQAVYAGVAVGIFVNGAYSLAKLAKSAVSLLAAAKSSYSFAKNFCSGKGGKLSFAVVLATVGMAWAQLAFSGSAGNMAFDEAVAGAIATSIVTIVWYLFTMYLGPVGSILSAIKMLLDALAGALCHAFLTEQEQQKEEWAHWVCGGVTGFLEQFIVALIYSGTILVDMDPYEDDPWYPRLGMYDFQPILVQETDGMVVQSTMRYNIGVTTTIMLADVPLRLHEDAWSYQFSGANLGKANFDYRWQAQPEDLHDIAPPLALGGMTWYGTFDGPPFYHTENVASDVEFPLTQVGINRPMENVYLSEVYAVPRQECWGFFEFKFCSIQTERGTFHYDMGANFRQDVLPRTLTEFYAPAEPAGAGKGYALAWGQVGDLKLPILADFDGDGLLREGDPGDPDDSRWDADGDGLSDAYELRNGLDPLMSDPDADGLSDLQEVRLGTDPWLRDSDGDGLLDCQEVFHEVVVAGDQDARDACGGLEAWSGGWEIVYEPEPGTRSNTLVTSNPLDPDTDRDGLTDHREMVYGYNPRAYSVLKVLSLDSKLSEEGLPVSDGIVAPGQTLAYDAAVKNELDNRRAKGLLWTVPSDVLDESATNPVRPQSFGLWTQEQVLMAGDLVVDGEAATGIYTVTQVAGALITDPRVESGKALLWLPFDDPQGATVFSDESGYGHDGVCAGTGCTLQPAAGRIGGALQLAGSGYVRSDAQVPNGPYGVSFWFKTQATTGHLFYADTQVSGTYRVQVYLSGGKICATIPGDATGRCTAATYNDGKWHHVVHTDRGSAAGGQMVYVDGTVAIGQGATSNTTWVSKAGVMIGGKSGSYLVGSIDDVRLFHDTLGTTQVQDLFNTPIFRMDFGDTSAWKDVSDSPATISTCTTQCPAHPTSGFAGGYAALDGSQYLHVEGAPKLNLSAGRFTLAAWINPRTRPPLAGKRNARDDFPQGIVGLESGTSSAYPTLQRVGRKIRFSLGTGTGWAEPYTSGEVLTENGWNHVVLTLDAEDTDNQLRLYVNGDLVEAKPFPYTPLSTIQSFDIGRSSSSASVSVSKLYSSWPAYTPSPSGSELHLDVGGQELWNAVLTGFGYEVSINKVKAFTGDASLRMYHQGLIQQQPCSFGGYGEINFSTEGPSFDSTGYSFDACGKGQLYLSYANNSIPFYGYMDEVQIFGRPLDLDSVRRLYLDIVTDLHLALDEAPGAEAFQDTSLPYVPASCDGDRCPASGVAGRLDAAAWFDHDEEDSILLGNFGDFTATSVAAWVYRAADTGARETVVSYKEGSGCGFVLAVEDDAPKFWVNVNGSWPAITGTGYQVPLNEWVHLAGTYDGTWLRLYYNGNEIGTPVSAASGMRQCTANTAIGSRNTQDSNWFSGLIDDVWVLDTALPQDRIADIYASAPALHLRFEEARGADRFADNADADRFGTCTGDACPATGEGVRGQIGLAAQFDGIDDSISLGDVNELDGLGDFTIAQWFYLDSLSPSSSGWAAPVGKGRFDTSPGWSVLVNTDSGKPADNKINLYLNAAPRASIPAPAGGWALGQWYHYAFTRRGSTIKGYLNGIEQVTGAYSDVIADNSYPLRVGVHAVGPYYWPGKLDDLRLYRRAITASQISDQYLYQSAWVEDRQSQWITVDDDVPTAEILLGDGTWLPWDGTAYVVGVTAHDPTSDIASVELCWRLGDSGTITCDAPEPAELCAPEAGQPEGAWCAAYDLPHGEVSTAYQLLARATDGVGHQGPWSNPVHVWTDCGRPQVSLDQASLPLDVAASTERNTRVVHLSGTVLDPPCQANAAAVTSGVPPDGVHVTLRQAGDPEHKALGTAGQTATVTRTGSTPNWSGVWSLDYEVPEAAVDGSYEVVAEAVDYMALIPDPSGNNASNHTGTNEVPIVLDGSGPAVLLDWKPALVDGLLGPDVKLLNGPTSDLPVPVRVDLTAVTGAKDTRAWLTCRLGDTTDWHTLFDLPEGGLADGSKRHWAGEIQRGTTCQVNLSTVAPAAEVTGTVRTGDEAIEVASWSGSFSGSKTVPFFVHSSAYALPGSPFDPASEPPWQDEVLRLPFDEPSGAQIFYDASGNGNDASCPDAVHCPAAGQAGHVASAVRFDGVDDHLSAPGLIQRTGALFTVAFWAKRDGTNRRDYVVSQGTDWNVFRMGYYYDSFECFVDTPLWAPGSYPDTDWHHWACTYGRRWDEGRQAWEKITSLYRDGEFLAQVSSFDDLPEFTGDLQIGRWEWSSGVFAYFRGAADDLRVLNRTLTAAEVKSLYLGTGPVLYLPFETSPATDGTILPDASDWGHDGTLYTGDALDKAVPGQVGTYALSFDGTDDYVSLGDVEALDGLGDFTIAQWFYLDALGLASAGRDFAAPVGKGRFDTSPAWSVLVNTDSSNPAGHRINLYLNGATRASIPAPAGGWALGQWYHYAFTRRGGTITSYLDGVGQAGSSSYASVVTGNSAPVLVGVHESGYYSWPGRLDDLRIYRHSMTADEIENMYGTGGFPVAGVQRVDVALRPVLPGSAFLNEVPLQDEVVHLPFEDTPTSDGGLVLRDVSDSGLNGSCTNCPALGQAGPSGNAAWFDGVDDSVNVRGIDLANASFTAAFWARRDAAGRWDIALSQGTSTTNEQLHIGFRNNNLFTCAFGANDVDTTNAYTDTGWHHWACTYDAATDTRTIYRDGVSVPTRGPTGSGDYHGSGDLYAGWFFANSTSFKGSLDDVRILTRALTPDQIRAAYLGSGPLLDLSFEKSWATDGTVLPDASGWAHDGTLHAADALNKAVPGQVGTYALSFDGTDDYVSLGDVDALDGLGDFTIAQWFYLDTLAPTTVYWEPTVGKGAWNGPGWSVMVNAVTGIPDQHMIRLYLNGDGRAAIAVPWGGWETRRWYHYAFTRSGSTITGYLDGVAMATGSYGDDVVANDRPVLLGKNEGGALYRLQGSLDGLRIYRRALSRLEVADLYHAGWWAASLSPVSGAGIESMGWTATVPGGLEGSYQVEMRGRDAAGHVEVMAEPSLLWSGEADNLAPRLSLSRQLLSGSTYRYTAVAQDYHLDKATYSSPCAPGVTPTYTDEYYKSPWYLGSGASQKLFGLTAVCDLSGTPSTATICDSLGNCTTCDYSNNCTTSAVAVAAAGGLEAGQEVALDAAAAPAAKPGPAGYEIIVPAIVTASHYYEPQTIDVAGQVTSNRKPGAGDHDLASVQVAIGGQVGPAILSAPAAGQPYTVTWTFPWHLEGGAPLPDGAAYTAVVTATDMAGRTTVVNRTLTADVLRPAPVTLSLAADGVPVEPGAVIRSTSLRDPVREPGAGLELTWTASSDGSGLAPYIAAWRFEDAYTTTIQTSLHDPDGPRAAHATAGEAQRVSVGLATRDVYGNTRLQAFGSVIVDGPLTPDYCALSEGADITGSACTLLGTDRRIARRTNTGRWTAQRLYGTWDSHALRLAWTGAHWNGDGDLFVYLDTEDGGTTTTFSPHTVAVTGTLITLPADLAADVLVWVQDASTASLMRWDGSQWAFETSLSSAQYRFDGGRNGGQADLYLPFDLLGTTAGAPLGLLAFAGEEPAADVGLQVWATLPLANPLNSERVNIRRGLAPAGSTLPLFHAYRWAALDDGVCPNGTNGVLAAEQHNDAVIELSVESNPPGASASGMSGGLFWEANPATILAATPSEDPTFGFLRTTRPPLPDGQEIVYTILYRNEGSHTLEGAWLALSAFGALRLAVDTLELGDIPAGGEGSVTFQATVDRNLSPYGLAAVLARLYTTNNGDSPLEWLVTLHRVDKGAPEEMGLDQTEVVVGPGAGRLAGIARDESGVSQVEIEVTSPSGAISTLICELPEDSSGGWSCPWDATAANGGMRPADGDEFTVRLRATDRLGQTSDWSLPRSVRVDAQPPSVTLPAELSGIYAGRLVQGNTLRLVGDALDNHALGTVTLCLDDTCRTADLGAPGASASGWSRWLRAPGAMDYLTRTLTISATDRLGNSLLEPLSLPLVFDNVPPVLSAGQLLARVPVGSAETVLSGEVTDGGPAVRVWVRVQPPQEGDLTRVLANSDGATWRFELPAAVVGQHTLWADAEDAAGNVTTAGPFTVDVTCTDAALAVTSLAVEPVAGSPMSLTLTVVISNAGPAGLPAGIPIVVAEGITPTGRVTTTMPLAAGEWEALSMVWGPSGGRDYELGVTAGQGIVLPDGPLCVAPPTTRFPVSLRDTALAFGWSLISPQLQPGQADIEVVLRGIDGPYSAILGYDGGPLAYDLGDPEGSNLKTVDALHGYWVHTSPATETLRFQTAATWRMTGEILPEDRPLSLAAGWNLAGYLPRQRLAVTAALEGIAGQYSAVLGFEHTALSTYPDLDPSYNTLAYMAPGYGYWIDAAEAVTFHYPITTITDTLTLTETRPVYERLFSVVITEWQAGVQPTYEWMNFYGELSLPVASPVPTGTVVLAVDPDGIICGATSVWQPGQFGLLACYGDDPATEADEGGEPGDLIELYVSTDGTQPDGELVGTGMWTAHGGRWEVGQEVQPAVDLAITKAVTPQVALPGATITYTLVYSNAGTDVAQGVVISDRLPAEIEATGYNHSGATITPTVGSEPLAWQVADLAPGAGGLITATGILSPALTGPLTITNTAVISTPFEMWPGDNLSKAVLQVSLPPLPNYVIWLPVIMRGAQ